MKLFRLEGKVQHYAWGGFKYIPELLGLPVTDQPSAEYWMGAHPSAPSTITLADGTTQLNKLIQDAPVAAVGPSVWEKFKELPFLFKILDVKDMLSIQVHPTKIEAEKGFARENAEGIPLNAPNRNYKDDNHKPEIMVALSEFYLLHGFLSEDKLLDILKATPEFASLISIFQNSGYFGLYKHVMEMPQADVETILRPLANRLVPDYNANNLQKTTPAFWAARAVVNDPQSNTKLDRGIFSIYFFNIMKVAPGGAVFQDAGMPHAYLEGQNVELMANSDNVLRGGLTPKHVDVPELLKHTRFEAVVPKIIEGNLSADGLERIYPTPAPDFEVSKIELKAGQTYKHQAKSGEIIILMSGDAKVSNEETSIDLHKGQSVFTEYQANYEITSSTEALLFKATAGL
ncbi:mannose-6-phosphate isomerase, class I [Chitinophaga silvatica]|uniref:mannose-6-phosphate isomerase n=1 Tax=Chitinophaga silvatica TaxID=2282649 RepID=A0A3E1Y3E1_9BACT|nr:mannose-6-phosphate isomerase, class I [Chitinophaga silvatica]RFS19208.1 mannose-6-phosphate isomerase, class I [Chitinophaga silvatica]